jgi:hypothetical protein
VGAEEFFERDGRGEEFLSGQSAKRLGRENGMKAQKRMFFPVLGVGCAMTAGQELREVLVALSGLAEDGELGDYEGFPREREGFQGRADDGADAMFFCGMVGAGGAVEAHVIDEADGFVSKFGGSSKEIFRKAGAAEKGERGFCEELHGSAILSKYCSLEQYFNCEFERLVNFE